MRVVFVLINISCFRVPVGARSREPIIVNLSYLGSRPDPSAEFRIARYSLVLTSGIREQVASQLVLWPFRF